jgi:hypothetical protein
MRALLEGKVLGHPATLQLAMSAPRPVASGANSKHGLIFFHDRIAGHASIGHAGFLNVKLVACPELDLVVALSLNQPLTAQPGERHQLVTAIVETVAKSR